jgi:hypothetical protein
MTAYDAATVELLEIGELADRDEMSARWFKYREAHPDHEARVLTVTELRKQGVTAASARAASLNGSSQTVESSTIPHTEPKPRAKRGRAAEDSLESQQPKPKAASGRPLASTLNDLIESEHEDPDIMTDSGTIIFIERMRQRREARRAPDQFTLWHLPAGEAPEPLLPPFLTPAGTTVIYGKGGRLKGYTALFFARELQRVHGFRVCILDFENHPWEWGARAVAMGFSDQERLAVNYLTPYGEHWPENWPRDSIDGLAKVLRKYFDERGCDYIIIDSYTTATDDGDSMGGAPSAKAFFNAISRLDRPTLVLAHVAGGQDRFPDKPFGSVFVHNLARETWAVEKPEARDEEDVFDPNEGTGMETIELRNKKANSSALQKPVYLRYTFHDDGSIEIGNATPERENVLDAVRHILESSSTPLTTKEIMAAIKSNEGRRVSEDTIRRTISRYEGGTFIRVTATKGLIKWAMASSAKGDAQ